MAGEMLARRGDLGLLEPATLALNPIMTCVQISFHLQYSNIVHFHSCFCHRSCPVSILCSSTPVVCHLCIQFLGGLSRSASNQWAPFALGDFAGLSTLSRATGTTSFTSRRTTLAAVTRSSTTTLTGDITVNVFWCCLSDIAAA
jgi:hypothetical protein